MTYQQIFKDVKKYFIKANTSHFTQEFAFQFNITGEGEGIFYAAYKNGVLAVEPYDYLDRDVIFETDGTTLREIAAGNLEIIDAVKAGKLAIDGNHEAAKQLLFLVNSKKTASKKAAPKSGAKKTEEKKAAAPVKKETKTAVKDLPKADAKKTETVAKKAKAAAKSAPKSADKEVKPAVKEAPKAAAKKNETAENKANTAAKSAPKAAAKEKKAPVKESKAAEKGKK